MVRSRWIMTAVFGLAWAGLSRGQAPTPAATPAERLVTLQELDKPGQKCRVLKTWREPDGTTAYLVQAVDSHELMTVVESGPATPSPGAGSRARAVATRIFHWGKSDTPPQGTPVPPASATALSTPPPPVAPPVAPLPAPLPAPPVAPPPAPPAVKPAQLTQAPTSPYSPQVQRTAQAVPETTRLQPMPQPVSPVPAVPQMAAGAVTVVPPSKPAACDCQCSPAGSPTTQSPCTTCETIPGTPLKSAVVNAPAEVVTTAPKRTGLLSRFFHKEEPCLACMPVETKVAPTAVPPPALVKAPTTPAQPSDYHESWGKVEPWTPSTKPEVVNMPAPRIEGPSKADLSRPAITLWTKPADKAPVTVTDPTRNPDWYQKNAVSALELKQTGHRDDKPGFAKATDRPGMTSVLVAPGAATDAGPNAFGPPGPPAPMGPPPTPPNPFRGPTVAMSPAMAPLPMDVGIPHGMANAFTPGGTARPIPADFGGIQYPDNAFSAPAVDAVAMMAPNIPQGGRPMPGYPVPGAFGGMPQVPPGMGGYRQVAYAMPVQPAMVRPPVAESLPEGVPVPQLLGMLKDSMYPSQREWAADCLAQQSWRTQPQVVQALVSAAREDPAPAVRAGCVRALGAMKASTPLVVQAMQSMKADGDPRVRHEVEEALMVLGAAPQTGEGIRPVSAMTPGEGRLP